MTKEVNAASELPLAALERHIDAWSALLDHSEKTLGALRSKALLDCVLNELSWIGAFDTIIQRIKATIPRTRNAIPSLAPANILPDEIWGQIFHLFIDWPVPGETQLNSSLDLPEEFLEELMALVQKLYLSGCYFHWPNKAYSNLTQLYLMPFGNSRGDATYSINLLELAQVSTSSPQLQVLYFGISITYGEADAHLLPVQLKHLEVLNLWFSEYYYDPIFSLYFRLIQNRCNYRSGFIRKQISLSVANVSSHFL
ncbi:hypothetical protein RSAG8_09795, partial [Rhizoctonia solani AG-8 WAC10335]